MPLHLACKCMCTYILKKNMHIQIQKYIYIKKNVNVCTDALASPK